MQNQVEITNEPTHVDYLEAGGKIAELEKQIENLREQVASADAAAIRSANELDAILSPLFSAIEPRIEALAEQVAEQAASDAAQEVLENFDISAYEYEIGEMIDDRTPDRQDEDEQREAVESIIKEVLSGATLTIDI